MKKIILLDEKDIKEMLATKFNVDTELIAIEYNTASAELKIAIDITASKEETTDDMLDSAKVPDLIVEEETEADKFKKITDDILIEGLNAGKNVPYIAREYGVTNTKYHEALRRRVRELRKEGASIKKSKGGRYPKGYKSIQDSSRL